MPQGFGYGSGFVDPNVNVKQKKNKKKAEMDKNETLFTEVCVNSVHVSVVSFAGNRVAGAVTRTEEGGSVISDEREE